jgi:protein-disulfide isomerase
MFSGPFVLVVGAVIVALIGVLAAVIMFGGDDASSSEQVAALDAHSANLPLDMVDGATIGSEDAPVKVKVFEDYQCLHCLNFTADQEGELIEEFVKSGDMQIEFAHLPLQGTESFDAAMASQCAADQDTFWQYHNRLFRIQAENEQSTRPQANVGRFSSDNLKDIAADLGLDTEEFNSCLDNGDHLDLISDQQREANQFGIRGTPGFLINGQPLGTGTPVDIDAWRELVEAVKAGPATATPDGETTGTPAAETTGTPDAGETPAATATTAP